MLFNASITVKDASKESIFSPLQQFAFRSLYRGCPGSTNGQFPERRNAAKFREQHLTVLPELRRVKVRMGLLQVSKVRAIGDTSRRHAHPFLGEKVRKLQAKTQHS